MRRGMRWRLRRGEVRSLVEVLGLGGRDCGRVRDDSRKRKAMVEAGEAMDRTTVRMVLGVLQYR